MSEEKISKFKTLPLEKFGYTTNLPDVKRLHDDVTDKNGKGLNNPAYQPVDNFRQKIRLLMGVTTTEEDNILKDVLDFQLLNRIFAKASVSDKAVELLDVLEKACEKNDKNLISKTWLDLKDALPYWMMGMLMQYTGPGDAAAKDNDKLPENDKEALHNLMEVMDAFNKASAKKGKEFTKDTPKASTDTAAKKNLDKAKKILNESVEPTVQNIANAIEPIGDAQVVSSDDTLQYGEGDDADQNVYEYIVKKQYTNNSDVPFDQELFSTAIEYIEKDLAGMDTFTDIQPIESNDHVELSVIGLDVSDKTLTATFDYKVYKIL